MQTASYGWSLLGTNEVTLGKDFELLFKIKWAFIFRIVGSVECDVISNNALHWVFKIAESEEETSQKLLQSKSR